MYNLPTNQYVGENMAVIHSGARTRNGPLAARIAVAASTRWSGLRSEVIAGSPDLARVGIVAIAMLVQMVVLFMPGHFRPAPNAAFALLVPLGTAISLALSFGSTWRLRERLTLRVRQVLGVSALLGLALLSIVGVWEGGMGIRAMVHGTPYGNDGAVMDLYAAQQVRHGHNPYLKSNIVSALAAINAPSTTTTPLMDGQFRGAGAYPSAAAVQQVFSNVLHYRSSAAVDFESKYNYPAGSFLFILPFVWAGIHDMRFLYLLAVALMGLYLWVRLPRALRPLAPFLVLADVPLVMLTTSGQPDPLYGLFLLLAYAEWTNPILSPVAMGLAIATKQLAWFFVPIYLLLIAREFGWRRGFTRLGIMASVFLLLNGPFILLSPSGYFTSIAGPMRDPMFPLGIGIVAIFVGNVVPMLPKLIFTIMELSSWAAASAASARWGLVTPAGGIALAVIPLFFAWRSLINYFYLVPLLTLAVTLADGARAAGQRRSA